MLRWMRVLVGNSRVVEAASAGIETSTIDAAMGVDLRFPRLRFLCDA